MRSAPARVASSAAATAQPRSLWVCRLMVTSGREGRLSQKYSTWSAKMFGVVASTVAGRLRITFCPFSGSQTRQTASQTSMEKSGSVWE